ncbi:MAG: nucleotidyltransferase domain-containing protein [Pseudomonadota bacterium]
MQAIQQLVDRIKLFPSPDKIILYGSRARRTNNHFSDIDIAVTGVKDKNEWREISKLADIEQSPIRTLLKIDLVQFENVDLDLQQSIIDEGKILYAR